MKKFPKFPLGEACSLDARNFNILTCSFCAFSIGVRIAYSGWGAMLLKRWRSSLFLLLVR